ncbi:hypothetical protein [Paenibacillus polymyxa]|nr:hypothetical protein [Paenibacillus polymyxa]URJ62043.3 hypothetical protein MF622_001851 [Paenibacillus polymyxa]
MRHATTITVANQKGGTGKTTPPTIWLTPYPMKKKRFCWWISTRRVI